MKPTLVKQPNNYAYQQLQVNFAGGVPLSADQLNFLWRHEKALSQHSIDPILKYYLHPFHSKSNYHSSFLLHREHIDATSAKELKRRLQLLLGDKKQRVKLNFSTQQFLELKNNAIPSLILYHGNQFLTGAPFYPGGIPHVIFFQWGNLFGVAKHVILPDEKALKSNVLIYFEDMNERNILQCVNDFKRDLHLELQHTPPVHTNHLENQLPQQNYSHSPFQTPKLSLSLASERRDEK